MVNYTGNEPMNEALVDDMLDDMLGDSKYREPLLQASILHIRGEVKAFGADGTGDMGELAILMSEWLEGYKAGLKANEGGKRR